MKRRLQLNLKQNKSLEIKFSSKKKMKKMFFEICMNIWFPQCLK